MEKTRTKQRRFSKEEKEEVCKLYINGKSSLEIAKIYFVCTPTIDYILKVNNIKKRTIKEAVCLSYKKGRKAVISKKLIEINKNRKSEKNPNWKGDIVSCGALHSWIRRRKIKPKFCECCGKTPPMDLANISQKYKRDINDFEWLCRRCHMYKDNRIKNLKQYRGNND